MQFLAVLFTALSFNHRKARAIDDFIDSNQSIVNSDFDEPAEYGTTFEQAEMLAKRKIIQDELKRLEEPAYLRRGLSARKLKQIERASAV